MAGSCSNKGVVDSSGMGAWRDEWQAQQLCLFERNRAGNVEIEVDTTILVQNGVSQHIGALDVLEVAFVMRSDLGVVFAHEAGRIGVGPQVVLPVRVEVTAAIHGGLVFGQVVASATESDMVNDFRDLGGLVDSLGVFV